MMKDHKKQSFIVGRRGIREHVHEKSKMKEDMVKTIQCLVKIMKRLWIKLMAGDCRINKQMFPHTAVYSAYIIHCCRILSSQIQ